MHIKLMVSGVILTSSLTLWGMGAGSASRPKREIVHAKRVADKMRDATVTPAPAAPVAQTPQAPVAPLVHVGSSLITRSPALGLITLPDAAAPTRTAAAPGIPDAGAPVGTVMSFMQDRAQGWQDRTVQALGQLTVQEQRVVSPMDDIEHTPPTPVVPQGEQDHPAPGPEEHPVLVATSAARVLFPEPVTVQAQASTTSAATGPR